LPLPNNFINTQKGEKTSMLTLLGSFLGLLGSFVPEFLKHVRDQSDKKHELQILDRQITMMQTSQKHRLENLDAIGNIREVEALYHHARPAGVAWVDALSGSVRPIVTYLFFLLYAATKGAQAVLLYQTLSISETLIHLWHPEDQALFAAVMSFWFGQRSLLKFRRLG
jgi:hypothetical protein